MERCILRRSLVLATVLAIACVMTCTEALAYFQRGSVSVYVGRGSVSLTQGSSSSVSVSFSPSSSRQLPGCGMAECPQSCGEKECLDANGECTCNGRTYQTYYPYASVSSSNTSVATASYSGGAVYITGISPGSATITVTGSLRQYTSTSASIAVTVSGKSSSGQGSGSSGGSSTDSSGGVTAKAAGEAESEDRTDRNRSTEASSIVKSDRGKITFVQIPDGKTGKDALESIMGKEEYVDFQKKDRAGTVLYAWEFLGTDVEEARDIDLNLDFSREAFEGCKYGSENDSVYISRGEQQALPGKASMYIRVSDWFDDADDLYLYSFDDDAEVKLIDENLTVENSYVTTTAMYGEGSRYILSTEKWDVEKVSVDENDNNAVWAIVIVVAAAAAAVVILMVRRRRTEKDVE